jgi:hypothetical protein
VRHYVAPQFRPVIVDFFCKDAVCFSYNTDCRVSQTGEHQRLGNGCPGAAQASFSTRTGCLLFARAGCCETSAAQRHFEGR